MIKDKSKFINLYAPALPALANLTISSNMLFFQYIAKKISQEVEQDFIFISYKDYSIIVDEKNRISKATYYKAVKTLLTNKILFKSTITNKYWINITYFFNGNRLKFLQQKENNS
jgi:hypothetical protein